MVWLLGTFLFGLISASRSGSRWLAVLAIVPVVYVAWRWWKRATTGTPKDGQGSLARNFERAGDLITLLAPLPSDALDILTDKLERREDEEERANAKRTEASQRSASSGSEPFDPDKAFARYMAGKEAQQPSLEPAPAPPSMIAPRTFGRRTT